MKYTWGEETLKWFYLLYKDKSRINIRHIIKEHWIDIIEHKKLNQIKWIYIKIDWKDTIIISENLSEYEKRFTLAHEFCHYLMWEESLSLSNNEFFKNYSNQESEKRADEFAMIFLLPKKAVFSEYLEYHNFDLLEEFFWVPKKIIERRIKMLLHNIYSWFNILI